MGPQRLLFLSERGERGRTFFNYHSAVLEKRQPVRSEEGGQSNIFPEPPCCLAPEEGWLEPHGLHQHEVSGTHLDAHDFSRWDQTRGVRTGLPG